MSVVDVENLTVSYGSNVAVESANLSLEQGMIHGLVGMNGSGKSTLFKALMGLVKADSGSIKLFQQDPNAAREQSRVAYTPQNEAVDWDFPVSVYDVVMTGRYGHLSSRRKPKATDHSAVEEALERVELQDFSARQIGALSGGQRKRAFVARSLAQQAELLLLDEPFAGVDKRSESTITQVLRELAEEGKTIFISTHDLIGVPQLCDRLALQNRKIIVHGKTDDVLKPELLSEAFGGFIPADVFNHADNSNTNEQAGAPR